MSLHLGKLFMMYVCLHSILCRAKLPAELLHVPKLGQSKCVRLVVVGTTQIKDIRSWSVGQFLRANSDIGMFQHPLRERPSLSKPNRR
jgi:hypothetical protein